VESRINILLSCLGIDSKSFLQFLEWVLSEQLVITISKKDPGRIRQYYSEPDGLRRFRDDLRNITGRNWSEHDLNLLFTAVKGRTEKHYREPIAYEEYLKLLWTVPHRCAKCGKEPPEVMLHIDHIIPASLGGASKRHNIQFLCGNCNLSKSNKLEGGKPWLDLR
jgi:5-methylcytosine-specific restriction endonuclease McrA